MVEKFGDDDVHILKAVTVRDLRNSFSRLEAWLLEGEQIRIEKRGRPIGILPAWPADAAPAQLRSQTLPHGGGRFGVTGFLQSRKCQPCGQRNLKGRQDEQSSRHFISLCAVSDPVQLCARRSVYGGIKQTRSWRSAQLGSLGLDGMQVARGAFDQNRDGAAADGAVFNEFVVALGGVNLGGVTLAAPWTIDECFL
jgi:hypothetical protein